MAIILHEIRILNMGPFSLSLYQGFDIIDLRFGKSPTATLLTRGNNSMKSIAIREYQKIAPHANDREFKVESAEFMQDSRVRDDGHTVSMFITDFWEHSVYEQGLATVNGAFTLSAYQVCGNEDFTVFKAEWIREGIGSKVESGYIAVGSLVSRHGETTAGAKANVALATMEKLVNIAKGKEKKEIRKLVYDALDMLGMSAITRATRWELAKLLDI